MAKDKSKNTIDVQEALVLQKKKTKRLLIVSICLFLTAVGGTVGFLNISKNKSEPTQILPLKSQEKISEDESVTFSRNLKKQTYMLKDGALLLEAEVVFYNRMCANLFNGITNIKEQKNVVPIFEEEESIGDKRVKACLNNILQNTSKSDLTSSEKISSLLRDELNKYYLATYKEEIVSEILVTNHVVK